FVEAEAPDRKGDFPGRMIDRQAFDARLVADACAAGADCRFATGVDAIDPDGTLTLGNGTQVVARVIIGADGPRSRVGRAIGQSNLEVVETRQMTVPLLHRHDATDIFLSGRIPGGYGWLFPKNDTANLGVGVEHGARALLRDLLDGLHRQLIAEGRIGKNVLGYTGGLIPVGGRLDPIGLLGQVPVLLAGDAAGLANPVTGAGIASAVISGTLAGEAAAQWIDGNSNSLANFESELSALFDGALNRALKRRRDLLSCYGRGGPAPTDLRQSWIGYPAYWRNDAPSTPNAARTTHDLLEA
ncbi:MAG: NAD(P)/FAD-dependent oxidoreductase, partial [Proteobacteria bacterium]|nr:NAD(P)/FAD-dependent oxidoreductase [Pseudomonadota bacterium]